MPISYVDDISDGSGAFIFFKILRRWRGSLYKLAWVDLSLYLVIYYTLNILYRFILTPEGKRVFEDAVRFCESTKGTIPVSFLLGFFVSGVIARWYQMYMYIPWMNHVAYSAMTLVNTADPMKSREIRKSLMRYLNLSWILLMRTISDQIADRFKPISPSSSSAEETGKCCWKSRRMNVKRSLNHPVHVSQVKGNENPSSSLEPRTPFTSGLPPIQLPITDDPTPREDSWLFKAFEGEDEWSIRSTLQGFNEDKNIRQTFGKIITEQEIKAFEFIAFQYFKQTRRRYLPEYWVPLQWAVRLTQKAGLNGHIQEPRLITSVLKEIGDFRKSLQTLQVYSSIMMPLVYTQVVIIAVYSYFACEVLASQFIEVPKKSGQPVVDFVVPIFSIFYFLFLMGWLKVALCVMNPFGDDDEDFETSDILNYNLDVSYRAVLMDEATYPDSLKAPTFEDTPMKGYEDDNIGEFVESVERELEQAKPVEENNATKNLEIQNTRCNCFKTKNKTRKAKSIFNDEMAMPSRPAPGPREHLDV